MYSFSQSLLYFLLTSMSTLTAHISINIVWVRCSKQWVVSVKNLHCKYTHGLFEIGKAHRFFFRGKTSTFAFTIPRRGKWKINKSGIILPKHQVFWIYDTIVNIFVEMFEQSGSLSWIRWNASSKDHPPIELSCVVFISLLSLVILLSLPRGHFVVWSFHRWSLKKYG